MRELGLIGYPLEHSFSPEYFRKKFLDESLVDWSYSLFPMPDIRELPDFLRRHKNLFGFNVTIPHKLSILPYLDEISTSALNVGAVNTVQIIKGNLIGYNTDVPAFIEVLEGISSLDKVSKALVLGTGGASLAVLNALDQLAILASTVSRQRGGGGTYTYEMLTPDIIDAHELIIQTTPLGMFPNIDRCPDIPYHAISGKHILVDLVYNPVETIFLKEGKKRGAVTLNGLQMLYLQAEKSWQIWTSDYDYE